MKSEFCHRFKISSDIFIDSIATKSIFDEMVFKTHGKIKGYLSNVGLDPFGFLLFSEIQVNLLAIYFNRYLISFKIWPNSS